MSVTRSQAIAKAQSIAQDAAAEPKALALLLADADYDIAIDVALQQFTLDKPNVRIQHVTIATQDFRYVLFGTGQLLPTAGLDTWIDGRTELINIFTPYLPATPDNEPLDPNQWRVVAMPADGSGPIIALELLADRPAAGSILRLEYARPHIVDADDIAKTSIRLGDVVAFETLLAAKICEAAARRYVQNTGSSTFQNETIDRRTQSDMMASRAKELMKTYGEIVGRADGSVSAAGAVRKMVIPTSHLRGRLWHLQ